MVRTGKTIAATIATITTAESIYVVCPERLGGETVQGLGGPVCVRFGTYPRRFGTLLIFDPERSLDPNASKEMARAAAPSGGGVHTG